MKNEKKIRAYHRSKVDPNSVYARPFRRAINFGLAPSGIHSSSSFLFTVFYLLFGLPKSWLPSCAAAEPPPGIHSFKFDFFLLFSGRFWSTQKLAFPVARPLNLRPIFTLSSSISFFVFCSFLVNPKAGFPVARPLNLSPVSTLSSSIYFYCLLKSTRVAAPSPRAGLGRRTVCKRMEQPRPPVSKRCETKVSML